MPDLLLERLRARRAVGVRFDLQNVLDMLFSEG